ncbi:MAG: hypothetical protein J6P15_01520, partial [Fibrobacter sp.]|nr:hypothetical protein [Fibrobacter sp.]
DNVKLKKIDAPEEVPEGLTKALRMSVKGLEQYSVFSINGAYLGRISADKAGLYKATKNLVKRPGMFLVKSEVGEAFKLNVK